MLLHPAGDRRGRVGAARGTGALSGTCRKLSDASGPNADVRSPALRLRADGARLTVHDLLHGEVAGTVEDFVVRRNDGVAAYNLAVVVDDAASDVDQVVRGDDLLPAAVNQAYLATLLERPPTYAHVPLAVNATVAGWPSVTVR